MKFLKTIRFDQSDLNVFEQAANEDEWAISGGFLYGGLKEEQLTGKHRQAFSNAFLSMDTYAFSTFTSVAECKEEDRQNIEQALAKYAVENMGAPSQSEALSFAKAEVEYVLDMCADAPVNSIFAVSRYFDEEDEIREEFRIVQASQEALHARVWDIVDE